MSQNVWATIHRSHIWCSKAIIHYWWQHLCGKKPPTVRKWGQPKGGGLTVIVLPKKKGKTVSTRPTAFVLKSEWHKTRGKMISTSCLIIGFVLLSIVMLNWFADQELSVWTCDTWWGSYRRRSSVTLKGFRGSAWMTMFVLVKSENTSHLVLGTSWSYNEYHVYSRGLDLLCVTHLHSSESICCDGCLDWVHFWSVVDWRELQRASIGFVDPVSVCNLVLILDYVFHVIS